MVMTTPFKRSARDVDAERHHFMSSSIKDMYQRPKKVESTVEEDENEEIDIRKLLKDVHNFGSSHMSWKERKKIENKNVLSLGGKPSKKQKVPLNIAKATMKNRKHKEQKLLQEGLILDKFIKHGGGRNDKLEKRKPEERALKASEGHFRNGILDVKHLLQPASSSRGENYVAGKNGKGKRGKKGRKNKQGVRKKH